MFNLKLSALCMAFAVPIIAAYSQNIVPNPGFEDFSVLPDEGGQWDRCDDWNNAGGSPAGGLFYGNPDYFHVDGTAPVKLPDTPFADLDPHSGDAIMGFLGYHDPYAGSEIREYIMVELTEPMTVGMEYEVSFWITNGFEGHGHRFKCDRIGINFSDGPLNQEISAPILDTPELEIDGELFTTEWEQKTFTYTADSAYTHLTIGNFYSDAETSVSIAVEGPLPFAGAYYFIDDFSIEPTGVSMGITTEETTNLFSIYPNPVTNYITVTLNETYAKETGYTIYSTSGQKVQTGILDETSRIELSALVPGTYYIDIAVNGVHSQQKFIKK